MMTYPPQAVSCRMGTIRGEMLAVDLARYAVLRREDEIVKQARLQFAGHVIEDTLLLSEQACLGPGHSSARFLDDQASSTLGSLLPPGSLPLRDHRPMLLRTSSLRSASSAEQRLDLCVDARAATVRLYYCLRCIAHRDRIPRVRVLTKRWYHHLFRIS